MGIHGRSIEQRVLLQPFTDPAATESGISSIKSALSDVTFGAGNGRALPEATVVLARGPAQPKAKGMFKMITAHLQFFAEVFGRNGLVLRQRRPEGRPDPRPRRALTALGRWRRQTAPPTA